MNEKEHQILIEQIQNYWNERIHDLEVATHPVGTEGFFGDLADYRFEKLHYLPNVVDFGGYRGKKILEIGCGAGIDLIRFAQGGARVTGIDLSETAIDLAKKYIAFKSLKADLNVMNGEAMAFKEGFYLAAGLIGGDCALCDECVGPQSGERCRHPFEARPSMEAMGIDVLETCRRVGLPLFLSSEKNVRWTGIVLLE